MRLSNIRYLIFFVYLCVVDKKEYLDFFQDTLEQGLIKICKSCSVITDESLADGKLFLSPDIEDRWTSMMKGYIADAVNNFNDFPDAAIGFASFVGMAVANQWDGDWEAHRDDSYESYYGTRGFDNMDDHILLEVLKLEDKDASYIGTLMISCASAAQTLIRRENIETQTELGFYVLARAYTSLFRIGAAVELARLGYKKSVI